MAEHEEVNYEQRFFQVQESRFSAIFNNLEKIAGRLMELTEEIHKAQNHCASVCINNFANKEDTKTELAATQQHINATDDRVVLIENKLSFWKGGGSFALLILTLCIGGASFITWTLDHLHLFKK